jgi:pyruvate/2-oxoacid:ferredoxin oxidoreductase alpha subunit
MAKQFLKGNEAVVKGAILAGCRAYYGYPITPASEIAHAAAMYMPLTGGTRRVKWRQSIWFMVPPQPANVS